jgi:hypothetical protein
MKPEIVQKVIDQFVMGFWLMAGASLCMWCLQQLAPIMPSVRLG